jgi:ABC-type sulfate transport system substrate-binding protein
LHADWITPENKQAAQAFINYLFSKPVQEAALLQYGFRPVDVSIPLMQPGSPFATYTAVGLQSDLSNLPTVEVPEGGVLNTLLDFWSRNIKR